MKITQDDAKKKFDKYFKRFLVEYKGKYVICIAESKDKLKSVLLKKAKIVKELKK